MAIRQHSAIVVVLRLLRIKLTIWSLPSPLESNRIRRQCLLLPSISYYRRSHLWIASRAKSDGGCLSATCAPLFHLVKSSKSNHFKWRVFRSRRFEIRPIDTRRWFVPLLPQSERSEALAAYAVAKKMIPYLLGLLMILWDICVG